MSARNAIRRVAVAGFAALGVLAAQWAFASIALAAAPAVTTGAASAVHGSSATLAGAVNPEGEEVTACQFEYGPSKSYGYTAPCTPAPGAGSSSVAVTAQISGLSLRPGSLVLHYRLQATNAGGIGSGEDETFETEPFAPPVTGALPASGIGQFTATLNGTLQTGEALVNYHFQYGLTTAYGEIAPIPDEYTPITAATVTVSQPVGGLQAGSTYHYRLIASSPGGTEVAGPDETFTTLPIPPPSVTTGVAGEVGVGAATLTGAIDPHAWDTSYAFQYGTSTAYGSSWPTVLIDMGALEGSQPVLVKVPGLLPDTTYHYRLIASNGGGISYGPDMTFTTGEYPAQAIQEPPTLRTIIVPGGKVVQPAVRQVTHKAKKKRKRRGKSVRAKKRKQGGKRAGRR